MRTGRSAVLLAAALAVAMAACENAAAPRDPGGAGPSFMPIEPIEPPDDGGGTGGGGGTTIPPFSPPPRPFIFASMGPPPIGGFENTHCEQVPHVGIAFSNDVVRGTPLYRWGVVVAGSIARFNIYTASGALVMSNETQRAHSNCVIHHEPEEFSTSGFAPGYYYVYASYWTLSGGFDGAPVGLEGRYVTVFRVR